MALDAPVMDESVETLPSTIAVLPFFASGRFPKPDLLGRCAAGQIIRTSGRDLLERVRDLSLGLGALGMARGDRVALLAESRPDWLLVDFAVLAAGAVTVPIYPTLSADQVAFILGDSEASIAVVSTPEQFAKIAQVAPDLPALRAIVVMDGAGEVTGTIPRLEVHTLAEVAARGHRTILDGWGVGRAFHDVAKSVRPDDLATIIYTSGTTNEPKGVLLTHGNLVSNLQGVTQVLELGPDDVALSFLPLCHAFERLVAYVYLATGVSMIFAESIDTVARDLKVVRPTMMTGVPRVFEKLQARILSTAREGGAVKRMLFAWAARVADARGERLPHGRALSPWLRLQSAVAERLVFRRVREGVGGRMRFAVSGSAPLSAGVGRFFYGMGLPIVEGYGLTETSPVLTVMPLEAIRFGTVGKPMPNVELRIAEDGEVLARGPNVMRGYLNRPEETAAALRDGWFHTGDIGTMDAEGYLHLTDRKKELIVTSGGKKIAPQPIEAELRAHVLIAEVVLLGDKRHFPAALIVPDVAALCAQFGAPRPVTPQDAEAFVARPDVHATFAEIVEAVNRRLAQYERIKKFLILPREFSLQTGELTPTLKVKRRAIEQLYRREIETLYR